MPQEQIVALENPRVFRATIYVCGMKRGTCGGACTAARLVALVSLHGCRLIRPPPQQNLVILRSNENRSPEKPRILQGYDFVVLSVLSEMQHRSPGWLVKRNEGICFKN